MKHAQQYELAGAHAGVEGKRRGIWGRDNDGRVTFIEGATLEQVIPLPEPPPAPPRDLSDRDAGSSAPPRVNPPLAPAAELRILQKRYPEGLWCTSPHPCDHRLIATAAAGWAKSWPGLSEAERLARRDAYRCAECRSDAAERERVTQVRREQAIRASHAARAARVLREEKPAEVDYGAEQRVGMDEAVPGHSKSTTSSTVSRDAPTRIGCGRAGRSGRPCVVSTDKRRGAASRSRAYRARKKAELAA